MNRDSTLDYRMPAEYEPHRATWLSWPHDRKTWPEELPQVEAIYVELIEHLHEGEEVHILVNDISEEERVSRKLVRRGIRRRIFLHLIPTQGTWIRDYGPMFVRRRNGRRTVIQWRFNTWGNKYQSHLKDGGVPRQIAFERHLPFVETDMVLEGGAIDVNGMGVLMTTEECLLNRNRNPDLRRSEIEKRLRRFLGIRRVLWLKRGIRGDDTDGHIDCVARFVGQNAIVAVRDETRTDFNSEILERNWNDLYKAEDQNGKPFRLISLPVPGKVMSGVKRLPASYANFYIGNRCVLVPIYGTKADSRALGILRDLFPKRRVIGIRCESLLKGLGAIHCVTREEPA